jgi:integrase
MARGINRLTGADLRRKTPGLFADGEGLWLQVSVAADGKRINRSWVFRYTRAARAREMGLGSLHTISLTEARERARKCRQQLLDGIDPLNQRQSERAAQAREEAKSVTFEEAARRYIAAKSGNWRNTKHVQQWPRSLSTYVFPVIGKLPVGTIDTPLVMKALGPVWDTAPETGSRIRGRIEAILDWATVSKLREGENPARWAGNLEHLLAAPPSKRQAKHHAAMHRREVPGFMSKLRALDSVGARALEFLVLTATRSGEALGAQWSEIDFDQRCWVIPADRMKNGEAHAIPLSGRCMAILEEMRAKGTDGLVFPGRDGQLAGATFQRLMQTLGRNETVHGFRSSFRDWCGEDTNFAREVAEDALAHQVGSAVERAYRRERGLEKRRRLMESWSQFCSRPDATGATVTRLRRRA